MTIISVQSLETLPGALALESTQARLSYFYGSALSLMDETKVVLNLSSLDAIQTAYALSYLLSF
jgi:hypothetical protein